VKYRLWGTATAPEIERFAEALASALEQRGFEPADDAVEANLVINMIDAGAPKPFRRRARGTFVAAIHQYPEPPSDVLQVNYPLMVGALSNIMLLYVPEKGVWFTTMERGHYGVEATNGEASLADEVIERLVPLATARLIIDNEFKTDLEPELWQGDAISQQVIEAGQRLGDLDLLPSPFPIEDILDEREIRYVKRLYGIGGLSYGNLSARKDERRFWMSASGVDKSKLEIPGRDILLVSDYDEENGRMVLSVPPDVEPRRVSVDAIEHWMIYQAHPDVGAILHVHAWVDGIAATDINFPCGTEQLAESVAELVAREPDPAHAVIGLRNHGITATGDSLPEILDRIEPRILRQIPMS